MQTISVFGKCTIFIGLFFVFGVEAARVKQVCKRTPDAYQKRESHQSTGVQKPKHRNQTVKKETVKKEKVYSATLPMLEESKKARLELEMLFAEYRPYTEILLRAGHNISERAMNCFELSKKFIDKRVSPSDADIAHSEEYLLFMQELLNKKNQL